MNETGGDARSNEVKVIIQIIQSHGQSQRGEDERAGRVHGDKYPGGIATQGWQPE